MQSPIDEDTGQTVNVTATLNRAATLVAWSIHIWNKRRAEKGFEVIADDVAQKQPSVTIWRMMRTTTRGNGEDQEKRRESRLFYKSEQ
jgi:hypothetical protein